MLSFVDALKQLIADTQATGGALIEHHRPTPELLQRLREYAFKCLAEIDAEQYILLDWFTEGEFDENVRVCVVHLHKLGITEEDRIYQLLILQ